MFFAFSKQLLWCTQVDLYLLQEKWHRDPRTLWHTYFSMFLLHDVEFPWIQMPFMACSEVSSIFSDWWLCWTNIIMITAVTSKLCSCLLWLLLWHLSQENWTYIVVNVIVPISLMDCNSTLQALLSCTLLQTLPELVTPLKGCSLISVQLSPDSVSALWKVWVLIQMWKRYRVKACT